MKVLKMVLRRRRRNRLVSVALNLFKYGLFLLLSAWYSPSVSAQSCAQPNRFTSLAGPNVSAPGKSFQAIRFIPINGSLTTHYSVFHLNEPAADLSISRQTGRIPRWSADDLPFFCKIEHQWAKNNPIPVKFRLGSVEYVDQLEGKIRSY
ncbi:MAG: hypothetical protein WCR52_03970 [Bacteroidota bacterium]